MGDQFGITRRRGPIAGALAPDLGRSRSETSPIVSAARIAMADRADLARQPAGGRSRYDHRFACRRYLVARLPTQRPSCDYDRRGEQYAFLDALRCGARLIEAIAA